MRSGSASVTLILNAGRALHTTGSVRERGNQMTHTRRPHNECSKCGHTWYPRGADRSRRCPACGSSGVALRELAKKGGVGSFVGLALLGVAHLVLGPTPRSSTADLFDAGTSGASDSAVAPLRSRTDVDTTHTGAESWGSHLVRSRRGSCRRSALLPAWSSRCEPRLSAARPAWIRRVNADCVRSALLSAWSLSREC